jgi:hypothetical protein
MKRVTQKVLIRWDEGFYFHVHNTIFDVNLQRNVSFSTQERRPSSFYFNPWQERSHSNALLGLMIWRCLERCLASDSEEVFLLYHVFSKSLEQTGKPPLNSVPFYSLNKWMNI